MVGSTRAQNGHWKSDHSMMVTLARSSPLTGELPIGTLKRSTFASGSAAAGICAMAPAPGPRPGPMYPPRKYPTASEINIAMMAVPLLIFLLQEKAGQKSKAVLCLKTARREAAV